MSGQEPIAFQAALIFSGCTKHSSGGIAWAALPAVSLWQ